MDHKQIIENIKKLKECATTYRNTVADTPQKEVSVVIGDKQLYLNDEMLQALSHAINCVGAIDQIKWERDIAIQQLNELGYDLGEKIREEDKRVKIISETIDGVKTGLIIPKADKE